MLQPPDAPMVHPSSLMRWGANEREIYENMAELYSIIKTTQHLEKAHMRDAITPEEYKAALGKLVVQYKKARRLTETSVPNIQKFLAEYRLDASAALDTLESGFSEVFVPEDPITKFFITAMDSLKLKMAAVDQLHPILTDLVECLSKIPSLGDFEGKHKLKNWLLKMNTMKASDELDEDQIRQLLFDLDSAYTAFHNCLAK